MGQIAVSDLAYFVVLAALKVNNRSAGEGNRTEAKDGNDSRANHNTMFGPRSIALTRLCRR